MIDECSWRKAQQGDPAAAAELIRLHYERIYAYFRRQCGSIPDAEDLTQKTFARAWASLASFQGKSSFSTWLHGIAWHLYVDWRRAPRRLELQPAEWWEECRDQGASPFETLAERDRAQQLYARVETLDLETRDAIHLHYYQGLTLAETAEVLGVSSGTVKNRLREAIASIQKAFQEPNRSVEPGVQAQVNRPLPSQI